MATKTPAGNILPVDTFSDIPIDATTGVFTVTSTAGATFQAGQKFLTLDDSRLYTVIPNGSGNLTIVADDGSLVIGVAGATLGRGVLVAQVTGTGKWALAAALPDKFSQGVTLRSQTNNQAAFIRISGQVIVLVANAITIDPAETFSSDAAGLATDAAITKPSGFSMEKAAVVGNGTTTFMLSMLTPHGNN